jgi:hypothetical protein
MATGLIRLPSRLALFICGTISILLSNAFRAMQTLIPDAHINWLIFSAALVLVGGLAVVVALLPISWLEKAFQNRAGHARQFVRTHQTARMLRGIFVSVNRWP